MSEEALDIRIAQLFHSMPYSFKLLKKICSFVPMRMTVML